MKLLWCPTGPIISSAQQLAERVDNQTVYQYSTLTAAILDKYCPKNYGLLLHKKLRPARIGLHQTIQKFTAYFSEIEALSKFYRATLLSDITLRDVFINNLPENIVFVLLLDLPDKFKNEETRLLKSTMVISTNPKLDQVTKDNDQIKTKINLEDLRVILTSP